MNIFFLHLDPRAAAILHHDTHVNSQIRESVELLSSVFLHYNTPNDPHTYLDSDRVKSHMNHPSAIWARQSIEHYDWLYALFVELLRQYEKRYDKKHSYEDYVDLLFIPPKDIPFGGFIPPPQVMPDEYKGTDTVLAYRTYYLNEKMKWANGRNNTYYRTGLTASRYEELLKEVDDDFQFE